MLAIRKWLYKPKKNDTHPLSRFYFADLDLVDISRELDSFDGRHDPERCIVLVNRLRACQDRVLGIIEEILVEALGNNRASREFRAKFPDDVLQETLGGQLWFGAECLAAGSVILNREIESAALRPLARYLTRTIDGLRVVLRDQCLKNTASYANKVKAALQKFDNIFAEFELSYVSAMVPVKTALEYDTQQDVIIMFVETVERALATQLITQEEVDYYEPALMFTIPRLAILSGLVHFPEGPLNMRSQENISEMFKPFYFLLLKIRELLQTLTSQELTLLEKALCSSGHTWEDIEKQLDDLQLSYDDSFGSFPEEYSSLASKYLSPVGSSMTECETACSSIPSVATLEDRLRSDASSSWYDASSYMSPGTKGASLPRNIGLHTSTQDPEESYCRKGHAKSERINIPDGKKRRRRSNPPVWSPDSLENGQGLINNAFSSRKLRSRRKVSLPDGRKKNLENGLDLSRDGCDQQAEDTDISDIKSTSKKSLTSLSPIEAERHIAGCSLLPKPPCLDGAKTPDSYKFHLVCREDSGLGTPSQCCSAEVLNSSFQSPSDSAKDLQTFSDAGDCQSPTDILSTTADTESQNHTSVSEFGSSDTEDHNESSKSRRTSDNIVVQSDSMDKLSDTYRRRLNHFGNSEIDTNMEAKHDMKNTCLAGQDRSSERNSGNISNTGRSDKSTKSEAVFYNSPNFPTFGKSGPSTELNPTGSMGSSTNDVFQWEENGEDTVLMWGPIDSSGSSSADVATEGECSTTSSQKSSKLSRLRHVSGSSTGSQVQSTSGFNRVTGAIGLAGPSCLSTGSVGSTGSCGSTCSCSSFSDDEDREDAFHSDYQWESEDSDSSGGLSDDENAREINMAIQAAEISARQQVRSHFRSCTDLVHRLFVCISGVADQLQTNYASDLRGILKTVFEVCATDPTHPIHLPETTWERVTEPQAASRHRSGRNTPEPLEQRQAQGPDGLCRHERRRHRSNGSRHRALSIEEPPPWMPDDNITECMACKSAFTVLRRKHHCRNCGQIFCARCSANAVPLPRFGQPKPVRVCNRCYMFQVTPFQT